MHQQQTAVQNPKPRTQQLWNQSFTVNTIYHQYHTPNLSLEHDHLSKNLKLIWNESQNSCQFVWRQGISLGCLIWNLLSLGGGSQTLDHPFCLDPKRVALMDLILKKHQRMFCPWHVEDLLRYKASYKETTLNYTQINVLEFLHNFYGQI